MGCIKCHGAPTFLGADYFVRFPQHNARDITFVLNLTKDLGRYEVTHMGADKNKWRVPSLRNVELTAPYFHNGSMRSLEDAVRIMGKTKIGKDLSDEDVSLIVGFLKTLTGKTPDEVPLKRME